MHKATLTIQTENGAVYASHVQNERVDFFYAGIAGAVQGAIACGGSVIGLDIVTGE